MRTTALTLYVILVISSGVDGATDPSDWSAVLQLPSGASITVITRHEDRLERNFVAANDSELVVASEARNVEHIARTDVIEVSVEASFKRQMWIGFLGVLITAGASAIGKAVDAEGGAAVGSLVGATAGTVLWYQKRSSVIYRAP